ncbi:MAG: hypothetical protein M3Z17_05885, partial [Gemmatimonadota bacterium]|nr:hypothetical protein [Gemmatimonadota bacterium]
MMLATVRGSLLSILLASIASPIRAQTTGATIRPGLYAAHRRFGPDVRGSLVIYSTPRGFSAEIAGSRVEFSARHDTISFDLPSRGGALIAFLSKDRSTISGHWIQPPTMSSGSEYASPITLARDAHGHWVGTVDPLDDTMTMFLAVRRRPDGSLGAFIRNPERNLGRQLRVDRIEVKDSAVLAIGKRNGNGAERILGQGKLTDDGEFNLYFSGRGVFEFRKVEQAEYTDFYPRGFHTASYSYVPPPTLG